MPRVLIVDDDDVQCLWLATLLEQQFEVQTAHNGCQALQFIEAAEPDVVMTDLLMPQMDGLELVQALHDRFPWLPVVVMTSYGNEELAVRCLQIGATSYLNKSSLKRQIIELLNDVLAAGRERRSEHDLYGSLERVEMHFNLKNDTRLIAALVHEVQQVVLQARFCEELESLRMGMAIGEVLQAAIYGNLEIDPESERLDQASLAALLAERRDAHPFCDRRVQVMARVMPAEVVLVVRDQRPVGDGRIPSSSLVQTFADECYYNRFGNQVTIIKRRPASVPLLN